MAISNRIKRITKRQNGIQNHWNLAEIKEKMANAIYSQYVGKDMPDEKRIAMMHLRDMANWHLHQANVLPDSFGRFFQGLQ